MIIFEALALMWSGAVMVLAGVVAGGLLVYRTKRESYETMFPAKAEKSDGPVHVDDMFPVDEEDPMQDVAMVQNARFLAELAKNTTKEEVAK